MVGVVQMASDIDRATNLRHVDTVLAKAHACDVVLFPEYVLSLAGDASVRRAARSEAQTHAELGALARRHHLTVIFGGVPVWQGEGPTPSLRNAALAYGPDGQVLARYDKMHLFQMARSGYDETRVFEAGTKPVCAPILGWQTLFSICYDIRFPELYRRMPPCDMLLCPAAFTQHSGQAHWHVLLRARAIENQCYVLAPAQCGTNAEVHVPKYGHSLVVDPWGTILLDAGPNQTGLFTLSLSRTLLHTIRSQFPALENRKIAL